MKNEDRQKLPQTRGETEETGPLPRGTVGGILEQKGGGLEKQVRSE